MKSFNKHSTSLRAKSKAMPSSLGEFVRRHFGPTRVVAVCLASLLAFSAFNANIASIVDLFQVSADNTTTASYFKADFKLYDYYDNGGTGRDIWFHKFNQKIFDSGYITGGDGGYGSDHDATIEEWGNGANQTQYLFAKGSGATHQGQIDSA